MPLAWKTKDGTALAIRPIAPGDVERLRVFSRSLSFGTRYFRYGNGEARFTTEEIRQTCTPDPTQCVHLLAMQVGGTEDMVAGSARIVFAPGGDTSTFAIVVKDTWHKHGVGRRLLGALIAESKRLGHREIRAEVLGTNRTMLAFVKRMGFVVEDSPEGEWLKIARRAP